MKASFYVAQTNIQLYKQLVCEGYSHADITRVRDSYELAATLFSGQFRGCGKTFIAHLVGAASVLVSLKKPVEQIQAGLLHSVYTFGDFGELAPGFSDGKRDRLRAIVGPDVDDLVYAFHNLKWDEASLGEVLQQDLSRLDASRRTAILIRLAHEIEEHADWSFLFSTKFDKTEVLRRLSMITQIAEKLRETQLAETAGQMAADVQQADSAMVPGAHRSGAVYVIVPASCRLRYTGRRLYRVLMNAVSGWSGLRRKAAG